MVHVFRGHGYSLDRTNEQVLQLTPLLTCMKKDTLRGSFTNFVNIFITGPIFLKFTFYTQDVKLKIKRFLFM